ncbi:MAG: type II secretion system protein [Candidatus Saccharimonadales bacterium]
MLTKIKSMKDEGFTIVEVLIVLAIAALILVIILIAVPDLQRSARNSDILHDAQNVASAIQSYEGNNQGSLPSIPTKNPSRGPDITIGAITTGSGSAKSAAVESAHIQASDYVFWDSGSVKAVSFTRPSPTTGDTVGVGYIFVDLKVNCSGNNPGSATGSTLTPAANTRAVAVYYPIEAPSATNGGNVGCIQE